MHPRYTGILVVNLLLHTAIVIAAEPGGTQIVNGMSSHAGKAGLLLRPGREARVRLKDLYMSHPLLDGITLFTNWREAEPKQGKISFTNLRREVDEWGKAGKGCVVSIHLYGQTPGDRDTPPWIYNQPDVRELKFGGGGVARGREIRIPAVWDEGFIEKYVEPLARELAREFDGHPHVWYVMPGFGHIGNITCQPSAGGSVACVKAGWTPEMWTDYCRRVMAVYRKHFKKTPIFLLSAGRYIRNRPTRNYHEHCNNLLQEFGKQGACVVHFGLEGDSRGAEMKELYVNVEGLLPAVRGGISRIGLGDDWPLWVPEHRRNQTPTRNHDDENLVRTVANAFGGKDGVPEIPTTILYCQQPEILASHPSGRDYRPKVHQTLAAARKRLIENDRKLANLNQKFK